MKKVIITFTLGALCVLAIPLVFYNQFYYPPLPIETMSKKQVLDIVNDSDEAIIKLTNEDGRDWYITAKRNTLEVAEIVEDMLRQQGWIFTEKDGSGLFFERNSERLIATTEIWGSDYVLVKIPTAS